MPDQAEQLRQLIHEAPAAARTAADGPPVIVVAGSRAGVGATTVAMNVAAVLADRGERVLVVDAAEERSNLLEIAGVRTSGEYSLADVLAGKCEISDAIVAGPSGTKLLATRGRVSPRLGFASRRDAATWALPATARACQQKLMAALRSLDNDVDLIVIDAGHGLSPPARRLWLRARLVLLVTSTEDSAVMDAYAAIKLHAAGARDAMCENIRVLVNQVENERIAADAQRRLSQCCGRFLGCEVAGLGPLPLSTEPVDASSRWPRVWEAPNSEFGHAVLWLGRAVNDVVAQ